MIRWRYDDHRTDPSGRPLIRWERQATKYLAFVQLAACLIIYRKLPPAASLCG
jgi:hypothetical protein